MLGGWSPSTLCPGSGPPDRATSRSDSTAKAFLAVSAPTRAVYDSPRLVNFLISAPSRLAPFPDLAFRPARPRCRQRNLHRALYARSQQRHGAAHVASPPSAPGGARLSCVSLALSRCICPTSALTLCLHDTALADAQGPLRARSEHLLHAASQRRRDQHAAEQPGQEDPGRRDPRRAGSRWRGRRLIAGNPRGMLPPRGLARVQLTRG